ncbi:hypothetical protein [Prosthecobacter fusiformis]|uniref:hypothetical protein n=1 Tax=Prosthecobacter fusiformis TaxID=48464 RepID=UPI00105C0751|nr:hypothetical protein [Prosthecobacter fusiformis]
MAPSACRKYFAASKQEEEEIHVLEVETLLPKDQRPKTASWVNGTELMKKEDLLQTDIRSSHLLEYYLSELPEDQTVPLNRRFRSACLGMICRKWINPYLVNLEMASRFMPERSYDHIVVAAGAGISFRAWTQVAAQYGLNVEFFDQEKRFLSIKRRMQRLINRWLKKPATLASATPESLISRPVEILCTSGRVARMLRSQPQAAELDWAYISVAALGRIKGPELERMKAAYAGWWQKCKTHLGKTLQQDAGNPKSILLDLGEQQSRDIYPAFALKYLRAKQLLEKARPQLLLCDTQEDTDERIWCLAAGELGINVAAYTYDHIPETRFSFTPDWLLCDSGRSNHIAGRLGHHPDKVVLVASHRSPRARTDEQAPQKNNVILYADTFYAGIYSTVEPQRSYSHYLLLVETARSMPNHQFYIKFHPLRDRKKKAQCFIGMDEDELYVRTQFIHSLNPPSNLSIIPPEESMQEHLLRAQVMLNANSTAAMEAFVLGVPVIFLHEPNIDRGFPLIYEYQACLLATDVDSVVSMLHRLENDAQFCTDQIHHQHQYADVFYWPTGRQSLVSGIGSVLVKSQKKNSPVQSNATEMTRQPNSNVAPLGALEQP